MPIKKPAVLLLTFCFIASFHLLQAQNCTVNAGIDQVICTSQAVTLTATTAGNQNASPNYQWALVSGSAVTITNPNALTTTVTGINPGTYIFRFSALCQDGVTAIDSVTVKLVPDPAQPLAGPDQQTCLLTPLNISANAPPAGQTGLWLLTAATTGAAITSPSSASTTVSLTTGGLKQVIWRITNGTCYKDDTLNISVLRPATVNAGTDINLSCSGTCATLNGSDPGISPQAGLWEYISGPSTPLFANPNLRNTTACNLVPGTYTFRWVVSGPCASGNDDVNVIVANIFSAPSLGNAVAYTSYCNDANVTSTVLKGTALKTGETAVWSNVSGSPAPAIATPNSASTIVSGLSGTGVYQFRYTVSNANCSSNITHTVYFQEALTGLSTPEDQQLNCDISITTVPITFSGITNTNGLTRNGILVSGPVTSGVSATRGGSGSNDVWTLTGMTAAGKYVFRFEYRDACGSMFRDVTIYASKTPTAANAGSSQLVPCNATSTSLAGNNPAVGKGSWSQVSGPNTVTFSSITSNTPTISNLVEGTYRFRWTVIGGNSCPPHQDEVTVIKASQTIVTADAGPDVSVCPGSFNLDGNTPGATQTGKWTVAPASGITFSNVNDPKTIVSGLAAGTVYTFTWTISNACSSNSDAVTITSNTNSALLKPNAGADACLSAGSTSIALNGNSNAYSISLWTAVDGGTVSNATSASASASISANGTYHFVYGLTAPGCTTLYDTVIYTVSAPVSTASAGANQDFCATVLPSSATLTATAPAVGTGMWDQVAGDAAAVIVNHSASSTQVNNLSAGQYQFRYMITNGVCASSEAYVVVNVTALPTTANAGADISQCSLASGTAVALTANTAVSGTGAWTIVSGPQGTAPTFSNASLPTSTITGLTTGIYTLRWTIATGAACTKSSDDMVLTVSRIADASATTAGYCDITAASLTGNTNSSGTWAVTSKPAGSPSVTITRISAESAVADNLARGAYTFQYSIPVIGSCPASSNNRTVTVYATPSAANAGADQTLCSGVTSSVLTGNTPATGTGTWALVSGPNTPVAGTANAMSYDTAMTGLVEGLYTYRYTVNTNTACTASTDDVTILKEKTASTAATQAFCNVTSASLTGNTPVYSTGNWSQISGPGTSTIQLSSSPSTPVSGLTTGTYVFRWTINAIGSCPATYSDGQVTIDAPVSPSNAGPDVTVCPGAAPAVIGAAGSGSYTYAWSPATYLSNAASTQPSFSGTAYPGTYTYTLSTINGSCAAYDQMVVTVRNYPADFSYTSACAPSFTAVDAGAGATYTWNFGSGATPATASTAGPHTIHYTTQGQKTVSLQTTDNNGCTSTKTAAVTPVCTLPVGLLNFSAGQNGSAIVLSWSLSATQNVHHFIVERSTNGSDYSNVGAVAFTTSVNTYRITDNTAATVYYRYYYRLKTVDADGSFRYSAVLTVYFNSTGDPVVVSPNPFAQQLSFVLHTDRNENMLRLQLFNSMGQIVGTKIYGGLAEGVHHLYLNDVSRLPAGTYLLRLQSNTGKQHHATVVKQ